MDTILAVFLAAAIGAGGTQQPAAEPPGKCEYYVSDAAQQVLLVCEGRPDGEARHPSLQQNPPPEQGFGASRQPYSSDGDAAGR